MRGFDVEVLADAARAVLDLALSRPPGLAAARLVCVDGPAGSGKTSLAGAVRHLAEERGLSVSLVHLDDVYPGWEGLPAVGGLLQGGVVAPLAEGRAGRYRRYDWLRGQYAEERTVPVSDLVVLEGVGSGDPGYADRVSVLVYVEAPEEVRLRRGLERDGPALEGRWRAWVLEEAALHHRDRTRERADVLVDGMTGVPTRLD